MIREALSKRDAALATERSEALKRILQEAGAALYAESSRVGREPQPNVGAPSGEARIRASRSRRRRRIQRELTQSR
jgi:molecular chaperone DnaK